MSVERDGGRRGPVGKARRVGTPLAPVVAREFVALAEIRGKLEMEHRERRRQRAIMVNKAWLQNYLDLSGLKAAIGGAAAVTA